MTNRYTPRRIWCRSAIVVVVVAATATLRRGIVADTNQRSRIVCGYPSFLQIVKEFCKVIIWLPRGVDLGRISCE